MVTAAFPGAISCARNSTGSRDPFRLRCRAGLEFGWRSPRTARPSRSSSSESLRPARPWPDCCSSAAAGFSLERWRRPASAGRCSFATTRSSRHQFEAIYYVGVPLTLVTLLLVGARPVWSRARSPWRGRRRIGRLRALGFPDNRERLRSRTGSRPPASGVRRLRGHQKDYRGAKRLCRPENGGEGPLVRRRPSLRLPSRWKPPAIRRGFAVRL